MKLSVVIPAFNEERTLGQVIARIREVEIAPVEREIIVVDDGSTDGTAALAEKMAGADLRLIRMPRNSGKGAALRRGFEEATGDYILVQDADMEYEPGDYPKLLEPILRGEADAVYGSRIRGANTKSYFSFYWGGRALTFVFNILYGKRLTDLTTCYKLFRRDDALGAGLECDGFEFCEEITAKLFLAGRRVREVPIRYRPRSFEAGKKIGWTDGVKAIWTMLRFRFSSRRRPA